MKMKVLYLYVFFCFLFQNPQASDSLRLVSLLTAGEIGRFMYVLCFFYYVDSNFLKRLVKYMGI